MNYVVGDIQGGYKGLRRLLKKAKFDPVNDTLWAVGDLIARGEDSLATLEYLYDLGDQFKTVLGNHDLHFLAIYNGVKKVKPADNLGNLLAAKDCAKYVDWLRHFPLARKITKHHLLVHAGVYPQWSTEDMLALSQEVEQKLQITDYADFLPHMYSSRPSDWNKCKDTEQRHTFIVNAMTRMRYIDKAMQLDFAEKGVPGYAPKSLTPWFDVPNKQLGKKDIVLFGHWASLEGQTKRDNRIGLDTGYVWGNQLTCYCLETGDKIAVNTHD